MSYLLAGGGTAGHVNPLLAVADGLRAADPDAEILVLGTKEGLESRLVPERGYELLTIERLPFPRRPSRAAAAFPVRFQRAVMHTRRIIRDRGVQVVAGFGGYASAPAYVAARRERVPFVVHEANAKPGLANVLGARAAAGVGVAFPGTPLRGARVVGMPLRRELIELDRDALREEAARRYGLDAAKPTLLVFGGSLGAQRLNEALAGSYEDVLAAGYQIVHVTGERSTWGDPGVAGYHVRAYEDRMDLAFALADVILSRAGSATVSEIGALGIPAIYVPYSVGNGEQRHNAASSVAAGAAVLLEDATFDADAVRRDVLPILLTPARLDAMRAAAESTGMRTGTEDVIALIEEARATRRRA